MGISRSYNWQALQEITKDCQYTVWDAKEWVEDPNNISLTDGLGNYSLFQWVSPGVYFGHFFYTARGKEAIKVAKESLEVIFSFPEVVSIVGLTPVEHLGARWLSKRIGFKSYGEVKTVPGPCEMFILTRKEYEEQI